MATVAEFAIDKTEVTQSWYRLWLDSRAAPDAPAAPFHAACTWNDNFFPQDNIDWQPDRPNAPVTEIDWCDAWAFCEAIGKSLCGHRGGGAIATDLAVGLNSQWTRACGGTSLSPYPYSDTHADGLCNDSTSSEGGVADVGSFTGCATVEEVVDLIGNIAEWEYSCEGTAEADSPCLTRGGSYLSDPTSATCTVAQPMPRNSKVSTIGFRCCSKP